MNIFEILCSTPFFPHWLDNINERKKSDEVLKLLYGYVLETGAGNCAKKERALKINNKITKYLATDYNSWDEIFEKQTNLIKSFGKITEALFGKPKRPEKLDAVCNALALPYKKNSFDCYISFEVLEHISQPSLFFKEANRVLKKGGICITVMPFLYREHGGVENDFQRITKGGFHYLAKESGFKIINISTYSYFGTTLASLINQFVIRKIAECNFILKAILLIPSPFIFFLTNTIGYLLDKIDKDERFAERLFVVMKKVK